jgi:hypothetical protein
VSDTEWDDEDLPDLEDDVEDELVLDEDDDWGADDDDDDS